MLLTEWSLEGGNGVEAPYDANDDSNNMLTSAHFAPLFTEARAGNRQSKHIDRLT